MTSLIGLAQTTTSVFRKSFLLLISTAAFGISATPAGAEDIINLSTGLDSANNLLMSGAQPDAHWTVDLPTGGQTPAETVFPDNADWTDGLSGPWVPNGPNSNWIARDANDPYGNGRGTYTRVFDLSALDPAMVAIEGKWSIDDHGFLSLNGHQISALNEGRPWTSLHSFSIPAGSPFFNPGLNTLTITINETDTFLEAIRLEGAVSAVPEPDAAFMLVAGLIVLFGTARVYKF